MEKGRGRQRKTTGVRVGSTRLEALAAALVESDEVILKATTDAAMTQDDHTALVAMAQKMASLNGYRAMQGSQMYIYDGDFIDWAWGNQHIFSFTWELYPKWGCGCGGFHPPDTAIAAQTSRNTDAALYLFEQADCPYREAGLAATYCS